MRARPGRSLYLNRKIQKTSYYIRLGSKHLKKRYILDGRVLRANRVGSILSGIFVLESGCAPHRLKWISAKANENEWKGKGKIFSVPDSLGRSTFGG